jgi:hypothetical protein
MKCHEILARISPDLVQEIFAYLLEHEKPFYKAAIQQLATQGKLRPIFIERKPKPLRHLWLRDALSRKGSSELAIQVLQIWLLGAHRNLIMQFLDALGIPHDGKGIIDELPPEPQRPTLEAGVTQVLGDHHPEVVAVYLHAMQAMEDRGWPILAEILATDPRLSLGKTE